MIELGIFLVISIGLVVTGIKALGPKGMLLTEGKRMGPALSSLFGLIAILFGALVGLIGIYIAFFAI